MQYIPPQDPIVAEAVRRNAAVARRAICDNDPGPGLRMIAWCALAAERGLRVNQLQLTRIARARAARGLA